MSPIEFKQQNIVFTAPAGMKDKVEQLPAFRGEGQVISCRLWFSVIGNAQPPIWLGVDCPFI